MKTKLVAQTEINDVIEALKAGLVVAIPTETVFGFAVLASRKDAFERLMDIKKRPAEKSFPIVVPNFETINTIANPSFTAHRIIQQFMPGPLTVVVPARAELPPHVNGGLDTVAIRMPDHTFVRTLMLSLNEPILLTSANLSGQPPLIDDSQVMSQFNGIADMVVKGNCSAAVPSTIVKVDGSKVMLLRDGSIPFATITSFSSQPFLVSIGSDHAAFDMKESMVRYLKSQGIEVSDVGTHSKESCDYPIYAIKAAEMVSQGIAQLGVVICGTGIGASIAANKVKGVRAALVHSVEFAKLSKQHNDANVLALSGRFNTVEENESFLNAWLQSFYEAGRHTRRVNQIHQYEMGRLKHE